MKTTVRGKSGCALLAAEVAGSGDPLVFLHARVADRRMWHHQMRAFADSHQAVAYDRRGFGETTATAEDYSAVEDLMSVLQATSNGSPAILVASSQGGGIALDAALRYPGHVRALVLIASSVTGAPKLAHAAQVEDLLHRLAQAEAMHELKEALAIRTRLWLDGPFQFDGRVTGEARALFEEMNTIALGLPAVGRNVDAAGAYGSLDKLSVPTLVMCGDLDLPGIDERSQYIATNVPGASFKRMAGAAHLPSLEQPLAVTREIGAFIDGLP